MHFGYAASVAGGKEVRAEVDQVRREQQGLGVAEAKARASFRRSLANLRSRNLRNPMPCVRFYPIFSIDPGILSNIAPDMYWPVKGARPL